MKEQRSKEVRGREVRGKKIRKEKLFSVIFASCFWLLCFFLAGNPAQAAQQGQVCFKERCVNVEVVQKQEELHRGLQFRESIGADSGMLFVFEKSWPYAFWMKDTLIPLDMIWIDETQRVVHIEDDVPPCTADPCPQYVPAGDALYVLEVNAGYAQKLGLQVGDTAEFRLNAF